MKKRSPNSSVALVSRLTEAVRGRRDRPTSNRQSGEEGAILILALAYLLAISLVVAVLTTWVSNDLDNSSKFSTANSLTAAASGMTDLAIQYVRYNPLITNNQPIAPATSPLVACWGGTSITAIPVIDGQQVAVWCTTQWTPLVATTRTVTFYACPISVTAGGCAAPGNSLLTAIVVYDDYPPAPARSAPIQDLCTVYCGEGMTIQSWQWGASSSGNVTGVAASMTFSNEPSDTNALSSTQAAVTVVDSSNSPVVGDTVTIVQQSGPSCGSPLGPCISSPSSVMTAITNTLGVAQFNNIVPQVQGNYTITAVDGSATATSTNFVVGLQRSVITPPSPPPKATQGGTPFTVTATATSGDVVSIAAPSSDNGICTLSANIVSFVGPGTCTLNLNDPATGSTTYAPALQVTLSFPVGGKTVTQVGITLGTTTPAESATTNDQVTVVLENSVGATQAASAPTTVVLSDIGNGFFSSTLGGTSASTLTLTFNTGQSTATTSAYFGDQTVGTDTISAVNGTTIWGTASLAVGVGSASQVAITPSTTTPGVNSLTNTTLTLQLEDSGGNFTTSGTPLTLTLSAPTGFFSSSTGTAGTSTLSVTFPSGVGSESVYFGDTKSGSDVITAKNGTTSVWATSTLTLTAGPATQVLITLNPTPPPKAGTTTNTAVTAQLEDQYGNAVQTNGVSLTFTNSGAGLFSAGAVGTRLSQSSASVTVMTMSGVATTSFGDTTVQSDTITVTGTGISTSTSPFTV
jgi:hypothetical protein